MTFQQLQYLLAVQRNGSISQAAKELFITQSAVSNTLAALEKELNCRIFTRSASGLMLTPEGGQIVSYAKRICENYSLLTSATKPGRPHLRVNAANYAPACKAFSRILDEYKDREEVELTFNERSNVDLFDRLLNGYSDICIALTVSVYDQSVAEQVKSKKLLREKLSVIPATICIGPGHRLYTAEDPTPRDFAEDRLVDVPGKELSKVGALLAYVPINKNKLLLCGSSMLRKEILQKGQGYSIGHMPSKELREKERLRYIPIPGLTYIVAAYTDPIRPMTPEVNRYLELLREEIRLSYDEWDERNAQL
ncbi:MAG: LysR family transcriptional regulator [Oscillospiraceae bacterium]|nr:LysR family transcriptional regulator [Oscillospiraceae bacterium]